MLSIFDCRYCICVACLYVSINHRVDSRSRWQASERRTSLHSSAVSAWSRTACTPVCRHSSSCSSPANRNKHKILNHSHVSRPSLTTNFNFMNAVRSFFVQTGLSLLLFPCVIYKIQTQHHSGIFGTLRFRDAATCATGIVAKKTVLTFARRKYSTLAYLSSPILVCLLLVLLQIMTNVITNQQTPHGGPLQDVGVVPKW